MSIKISINQKQNAMKKIIGLLAVLCLFALDAMPQSYGKSTEPPLTCVIVNNVNVNVLQIEFPATPCLLSGYAMNRYRMNVHAENPVELYFQTMDALQGEGRHDPGELFSSFYTLSNTISSEYPDFQAPFWNMIR